MKNLLLIVLCLIGLSSNAQTSKELIGKWQLVKWVQNDKEKDIASYFKTDQVFQVFQEGNEFHSLIGEETHKGKWKLSKDNSELTINAGLLPVKFKIDYFDANKRVVSTLQLGSFEYKKVTE